MIPPRERSKASTMIELEKTYLAKKLPQDLKEYAHKEIIDIYIPQIAAHPKIRIRKNGLLFEITKKEPINIADASCQKEQTIKLTEIEFNSMLALEGKKIHKLRFSVPYKKQIAEIDVFQGALSGLVLVDFEFSSTIEKDSFELPDFCLAEITQEEFTAGGMLCGKNYTSIQHHLSKFNYKPLYLD